MEPSALLIPPCTYHIFLSFQGSDTRKNFTDHLYTALVQAGIHTFRDDEAIERGKDNKDEINKVILHRSKISIVVFSKDYASSTRCLDELVMILEHKISSQHVVLPVFYDVDPSQVKNQTGSYAEAFARHEERFKSDMKMVQRWRAALKQVADLGGMVLHDRHESQFIQDIVKQVQNRVHPNLLDIPPYLVGIDSLVTRINLWLQQDGSNNIDIATIYGIGGIGKTTVAKVVYNQNIQRFEGYSFLSDVRETGRDRNGLVRLQRQLISDLLKRKSQKIYNTDDGINRIKEAVCCRRVLLVLDDVDDLDNITKLIGTGIPFHPGSKIIVTSRHRCLLNAQFISQMFEVEASSSHGDSGNLFEVKEISSSESLQLFNWYAFGPNSMPDSFVKYATCLVKLCGGLPLALQLLASSLCSKSPSVWESSLEKLEAIPHSKIQKILRISYDSLGDDHDKSLFLDIACLFVGKDKDYVTTILDGCDFYTANGIENLIGRSLLFIDEKNKLMMHQMIRNMGREIVSQESSDIGKRSRLWHKDAFDVLTKKTGSRTVKCLSLDLKALREDKSKRTSTSLHFPKHSKNQCLVSNEVDMETRAFGKMHRLKLLQLDYAKLKGDFKDFPKSLIWLHWHGFPMQSLPVDFDIRRLVVLDLRNNDLKQVWKDTECLPFLKILNLNHSHSLVKTPNFSGLPSLEKLMLKDCIKLVEVDPSIGELNRLTFLNLKDCKSLRKLPRTIGSLISLEELILSGCSRLDDVPRELHNMESLKVLNLDETSIHQTRFWLPWILSKSNKKLGLCWASLPSSLVKLSLESCRISDDVMPDNLANLASLRSLNLSRNPIHCLPESIENLTKLDELVLTCCTQLQTIPKLSMLLNMAWITVSLESSIKLYLSSTPVYFFSTKRCVFYGCERLSEVQGIFKLESIENFEEEEIKRLFGMGSIDRNQVQLYSYITDTMMLATPQVLQEGCITSIFVIGSEVPNGFKHYSNQHHLSFTVPNEKVHWFKLCIVFSITSDRIFDFLPSVCIFNETKKIKWNYRSSVIGLPKTFDNRMLWLIHWPATYFQLEGGDLVSFMVNPVHLSITKFGVAYDSNDDIRYEYGIPESLTGDEHAATKMEMDVRTKTLLSLNSYENIRVQIWNYLPEPKMVVSPQMDLTKAILSLESYENVKVQICNYLQESKVFTSPQQVLYDYGITTAIDPIPFDYFGQFYGHQAGRAEVSVSVSPKSAQKISYLINSIIILSGNNDRTFEFLPCLEIVNETKSRKWTYSKHFTGFPESRNTLYWMMCWKFSGDEFEAGDLISLQVVSDLSVLEFAVDLVYDYEVDDNADSLHRLLGMSRYSGYLFGVFSYLSRKSLKTLYRMQSLVKC